MPKYHPGKRRVLHAAVRIKIQETLMYKAFLGALVGAAVVLAAPLASAQQAPAAKKAPASSAGPKAGAGEKVCRHKFPDGTPNAWVCKKEEPCCAWDEIKYVKCGSTVFKCL